MRDRLALTGIAALFIAIRMPLLFDGALPLGWNSESAILGLMAMDIASGRDYPLFFWGQSYLGAMTAYVAAPLIWMMNPMRALRIGVSLQVLAGIVFYWMAFRRSFNPRVANVTALWLAIGPAYMVFFSVATLGIEQMFLIGAVVYWFATLTGMARPRDWFVLGLLAGFGWWIHQGTVFTAGPVIVTAILRSQWWNRVRRAPWNRRPGTVAIAIAALLFAGLIFGVLRYSGINAPAFFLFRPIIEPLVALFLLAIIVNRTALRTLLPIERSDSKAVALFAAGALAGHSPVLIGRMAGFVQGYGRNDPLVGLRGIAAHAVTFLQADLWLFVGVVASIIVVPCFVVAVIRRRRFDMELMTIVLCVVFYVFMERARPGSVRYIVSALPMVYAFSAETMLRLRIRWLLVTLVALALLVPAIGLVRDVSGGRAESYAGTPIDLDPRPILRAIEEEGYTICYADYWIAYKLQWVSAERVRFIPWRSLDRNRAMSRELMAAPGPKCIVDAGGRVRAVANEDLDHPVARRARENLRRRRISNELTSP
ncbi:MAG: glycosyltransferase family 39 protein [Acidobacteriota bacterium]|nr:glycosyltransferase family 39 protein [Acidobacteriota bacterium]